MIQRCDRAPDHGILFKCGEVSRASLSDLHVVRSLPLRQGSRSGRVAQLVEHSTLNRLVVGSIPTASTNYLYGSLTEWAPIGWTWPISALHRLRSIGD